MAQITRFDEAGAWHHVMNRGLARRAAFETRADIRYFLSRLARTVRLGILEVHAYSVLTTHFHLLVRSPQGDLSRAMLLVQNGYVRWFNRRVRRDGPLFRGRFRSRRVDSVEYWTTLLRYIDQNAGAAGLVADPALYPYGSAWHYARPSGPPWLSRSVTERAVRTQLGRTEYAPQDYRKVFGVPLNTAQMELVDRRVCASSHQEDEFADLVHAAPAEVRAWMSWKARLADGTRPGVPVVSPQALAACIHGMPSPGPSWSVKQGRISVDAWLVLNAGLLRTGSGLRFKEIGMHLGCSESKARRSVELHARLLGRGDLYLDTAVRVLHEAMRLEQRAPPVE